MNQAHGELGHRLATLRSDFTSLGTRAAGAAEALVATLPPPTELLEELTAARLAFVDLRSAMVEQAGALSITLEAESLGTLRDLEPVLDAIAAAEAHRVRLAAWESARKDALLVLERVRAIVHREDRSLPTLTECQGRARELHATLAGPAPEALDEETTRLPERTRPYTELLALIEGWNVLDDDRCAVLQDAITESFGRTLALAALRGKLGREGEAPPPPPVSRARPRPPTRAPELAPAAAGAEPPRSGGPGGRRATARRASAGCRAADRAEPAARSRPRGRGGAAAGPPSPGNAAPAACRHRPGRGAAAGRRGGARACRRRRAAAPCWRTPGSVATPSRSRGRRRVAIRRSSSSGSPRRPPAGGSPPGPAGTGCASAG